MSTSQSEAHSLPSYTTLELMGERLSAFDILKRSICSKDPFWETKQIDVASNCQQAYGLWSALEFMQNQVLHISESDQGALVSGPCLFRSHPKHSTGCQVPNTPGHQATLFPLSHTNTGTALEKHRAYAFGSEPSEFSAPGLGSHQPPQLLSEGDAQQPCRRRVVAPVVQRAEMTSRAPEYLLARVVQAALKASMIGIELTLTLIPGMDLSAIGALLSSSRGDIIQPVTVCWL
ncbi:hypothetical protein E5288_WYG021633 [Bos mutus]|uniref:Uncharacterized protein n=1 Tax=Bos mutus TaxID=72004 RepID=A0A6B0SKB9_9CETA|nr:hypothetical protein [Bos mutus]